MNYHKLAFQFLSVRLNYLESAIGESFRPGNGRWQKEDWHRMMRERAVLNAVRYIIRNVLDDEGRAELSTNIRQIMALRKRLGHKD